MEIDIDIYKINLTAVQEESNEDISGSTLKIQHNSLKKKESSLLPAILLPDIHRLAFHLCVFLLWDSVQPRKWNRLVLDNAECIENIAGWCFRNMHITCISTMTIQKFSSGSWKNCLFFCVCRDFAGFVGLKVLERKYMCSYKYLDTLTTRRHITEIFKIQCLYQNSEPCNQTSYLVNCTIASHSPTFLIFSFFSTSFG